MKATLLDSMGSDLTVVNAARVSFAKRSEFRFQWTADQPLGLALTEKDVKLIHYLAKHNHWSPFAHPQLSFHIEAPIFVARQLAKHQVGGVWNEVSRRYVDEEPACYHPALFRKRADNVKQGSSAETIKVHDNIYNHSVAVALQSYRAMLAMGVCPEQARMVLPLATYTEWHWTGSLAFFARVCKQRLDTHTQQETRELVQQISEQIEPLFPHSWKALNDHS